MRIINFNNKDTWTAWKKAYVDDLNIKITSLWNHLVYKNPPYIILNSVTDSSPIDLDKEGYRITVNKIGGGSVDIYFPAMLQFHQGFYNSSNNGDAVFGYRNKSDNKIYPLTANATFQPFTYDSSVAIYVESYNFPSGYCCISNIMPEGINNEYNEKRQQLSSYLLYPLGNGSFFTYHTDQSNFIATYHRNDMEDFTSRTIFSLVSNGRYTTKNTAINTNGFWGGLNCGLTSINGPYTPQITDSNDNTWSGSQDLVAEVYNNNNELIICDSQQNIRSEVTYQTLTWRAELSTNIKDIKNHRVEIY